MKRLILPVVMVLAGLTVSTAAQGKDLAGSWVLDVEKSGKKDGPAMVIITLTEKEFTAQLGGEKAKPLTFRLDGSETSLEADRKIRAEWRGNKLNATMTTENGSDTISFSRDGVWLVMEGTSRDHGPMKFYFKKAAGK